jgi:hypothetical protein
MPQTRCCVSGAEEAGKAPEMAADKGSVPASSSAKAKRKAVLAKANAEGAKGTILDAFVTPPPTQPEAPRDTGPKAVPSQPPAEEAPQAVKQHVSFSACLWSRLAKPRAMCLVGCQVSRWVRV